MPPRQNAPPPPDFEGIPVGETTAQFPQPPPLLGGVPEYPLTDETGAQVYDENGRPITIPYATPRTQDYGAETRAPGGGLQYQPRPYTELVPARFREGDQYFIYSMTPEQVAALQDRLIAAGLLPPSAVTSRGFVGPADSDPTFAAYEELLAFANQAGYASPTQALDALRKTPVQPAGRAHLPPQTSNPDDLRRVFRAAVIDTLGQGWSEDQINGMVDAYQSLEIEHANRAAGMQDQVALGVTPGGTLEAPPSPETFAVNQAREADPVGAQASDFLGAANLFQSLLGQWQPSGGELPNT